MGCGIRPSLTISSNRVGETPTYAAACTRERPRGGKLVGKMFSRRPTSDYLLETSGAATAIPK